NSPNRANPGAFHGQEVFCVNRGFSPRCGSRTDTRAPTDVLTMHHFAYRNGVMHCEDVSLEAVARELGTPAYVYSDATLRRHYNVLADAFQGRDVLIAYAVKANSNLGVIATLASM